jgi:hypothetical protein
MRKHAVRLVATRCCFSRHPSGSSISIAANELNYGKNSL